ncbi:hypothetical protein Phum_PHUM106880 [Pediculus humanus corporis]|uniref:Uncharacterized protein n=1 Tax=Pediculus humanus subsp. corporis TaxID=121224 RepID=E0VD95_PEDHC|nr:uncharacterized protein Phum_PHUM106880 [Pediculus humanus corporis]EEB11351.1 hypothetical protein Phum_PHUM106880 [Pediculus humanus corporis]
MNNEKSKSKNKKLKSMKANSGSNSNAQDENLCSDSDYYFLAAYTTAIVFTSQFLGFLVPVP